MISKPTWQAWKIGVGVALAIVLALDIGLASYLFHMSSEQPLTLKVERDRLELQAKKLHADVSRGEQIRASLPQAGKDCDNFYQQSFLESSTGYSRIESDLGEIAGKSGVRISDYTFKQKDVKDRGVTEIQITAALDADYPAVIQFINGLERSEEFLSARQPPSGGGFDRRAAAGARTSHVF